MITRQQIIQDLETLALRLGNELPYVDPEVAAGEKEMPDPNHPAVLARAAEWNYTKGIIGGRILQLRDDLLQSIPDEFR